MYIRVKRIEKGWRKRRRREMIEMGVDRYGKVEGEWGENSRRGRWVWRRERKRYVCLEKT